MLSFLKMAQQASSFRERRHLLKTNVFGFLLVRVLLMSAILPCDLIIRLPYQQVSSYSVRASIGHCAPLFVALFGGSLGDRLFLCQ